jgi:hypothetical protein
MTNEVTKPNLTVQDGFDVDEQIDRRLIQGAIVKFVDGKWTMGGEPWPADTRVIVVDGLRAIQRWQAQKPIETFMDLPLPDLDNLNSKIPEEQWETDRDGNLRKPYQLNHVIYLLDPLTAAKFTSINSTIGQKVAYERLQDSIKMMRKLRGAHVSPIVKLSTTMMKTKRGLKQRPDLVIVDWIQFGPAQLPANEVKAIAPPSTGEIIDDEIPF